MRTVRVLSLRRGSKRVVRRGACCPMVMRGSPGTPQGSLRPCAWWALRWHLLQRLNAPLTVPTSPYRSLSVPISPSGGVCPRADVRSFRDGYVGIGRGVPPSRGEHDNTGCSRIGWNVRPLGRVPTVRRPCCVTLTGEECTSARAVLALLMDWWCRTNTTPPESVNPLATS